MAYDHTVRRGIVPKVSSSSIEETYTIRSLTIRKYMQLPAPRQGVLGAVHETREARPSKSSFDRRTVVPSVLYRGSTVSWSTSSGWPTLSAVVMTYVAPLRIDASF